MEYCKRGHERTTENTLPNGQCRECLAITAKAWREAHPEYHKKWLESNPEYYKKWREENPRTPLTREQERDRYIRKKEIDTERKKRRRAADPEAFRKKEKEYRERNKEKMAQYYKARYELTKKAKFSREFIFERDNWICWICGKKIELTDNLEWKDMPTIDHAVPLSRGGEHTIENCRTAHMGCNKSKGNRLPGEICGTYKYPR